MIFAPKVSRIWFLQQCVYIAVAILILAVLFNSFIQEAHADLAFNNKTRYVLKSARMPIVIQNILPEETLVQISLERPGFSNSETPIALNNPLIKIGALTSKTVEVIYKGAGLPEDRESLFILSVREIPHKIRSDNLVHLSLNHKFKLFYRPGLISDSERKKTIVWAKDSSNNTKLILNNKSPYYVTISQLKGAGLGLNCNLSIDHIMVAPFTQEKVSAGCEIHSMNYSQVTDEGNLRPFKVDFTESENLPYAM